MLCVDHMSQALFRKFGFLGCYNVIHHCSGLERLTARKHYVCSVVVSRRFVPFSIGLSDVEDRQLIWCSIKFSLVFKEREKGLLKESKCSIFQTKTTKALIVVNTRPATNVCNQYNMCQAIYCCKTNLVWYCYTNI